MGCNLCVAACPIPDCIQLERWTEGVDPRTGLTIQKEPLCWPDHPNNPECALATLPAGREA
ncbi:hypothetical protein [Acidithiobacillus caldus]|uniref:hypothetical protein n=1 Tax=Acidithiobacillus caldus TaxID=33059 RepID=UPI003B8A62B6